MITNFTIGQGNLLGTIDGVIFNADGSVMNLTSCTVRFHMRKEGAASAKIDQPASIVNAVTGQVSYAWQSNDTDTDGVFEAEFEVTTPSTKKITAPNGTKLTVTITPKLA